MADETDLTDPYPDRLPEKPYPTDETDQNFHANTAKKFFSNPYANAYASTKDQEKMNGESLEQSMVEKVDGTMDPDT